MELVPLNTKKLKSASLDQSPCWIAHEEEENVYVLIDDAEIFDTKCKSYSQNTPRSAVQVTSPSSESSQPVSRIHYRSPITGFEGLRVTSVLQSSNIASVLFQVLSYSPTQPASPSTQSVAELELSEIVEIHEREARLGRIREWIQAQGNIVELPDETEAASIGQVRLADSKEWIRGPSKHKAPQPSPPLIKKESTSIRRRHSKKPKSSSCSCLDCFWFILAELLICGVIGTSLWLFKTRPLTFWFYCATVLLSFKKAEMNIENLLRRPSNPGLPPIKPDQTIPEISNLPKLHLIEQIASENYIPLDRIWSYCEANVSKIEECHIDWQRFGRDVEAKFPNTKISYFRSKDGEEFEFVMNFSGGSTLAVANYGFGTGKLNFKVTIESENDMPIDYHVQWVLPISMDKLALFFSPSSHCIIQLIDLNFINRCPE